MLSDARWREPDAEAKPPPRPPFFDSRYVLPQHRVKLLETKHPHIRDDRIIFYEEPHIYTVDGLPVQESVSGLANEFESEFDPDQSIQLMKRSRKVRWPRLQYVLNAQKIEAVDMFVANKGAMLVDTEVDETISSIEANHGQTGQAVLERLQDAAVRRANKVDMYVFDRSLTDEEIKTKWEQNGEEARNRGTEAHLQMELWFNSEPVRHDEGEVKVGLEFVKKCLVPLGAKGFRTEWTIFGEEENVAGCIDLAAVLPNGDLYLVDWKRSEKLPKKMYGFKPMKSPLNHLEDCSGCAYALQLSSYQYIIEKYYGKKVAGRALASIHPDNPFATAVPYLKEEAEYLMARRRATTTARKALMRHPDVGSITCALSKCVVMKAVRDKDGVLYDAKMAKLKAIETVDDDATTAKVMQMMAPETPNVSIKPGLPSWKVRFPKPTDDLMRYS